MSASTTKRLLSALSSAWGKVQPSGTLQTWLPYHPMSGMEQYSFETGLELGYNKIIKAAQSRILLEVNKQSIQLLPLFFDKKQAAWSMPGRTKNLYLSILTVYYYQAHDFKKAQEALLLEPFELIQKAVEQLKISPMQYESFFECLLDALPGWAAFIRYQSAQNEGQNWQVEYMALRCYWAMEYQIDAQQLLKEETPNLLKLSLKKIAEAEKEIDHQLCQALSFAKQKSYQLKPQAHFIFCMDTRSGPLREVIEQLGPYKTEGLAGFWGLDIAVESSHSSEKKNHCPALITPSETVKAEAVMPSWSQSCLELLTGLDGYLKKRPLSLLCWVECFGVVYGLLSWLHTTGFSPLGLDKTDTLGENAYLQISLEKQVSYALRFLNNFNINAMSNLVIICGHGSQTLNNIFAAKLQCGACGNYRGIQNARVMAQILNDKKVQMVLQNQHGVDVSQIFFLAAEHNTVTEAIAFDDNLSECVASELWQQIILDLQRAEHMSMLKKLSTLQCGPSYHWAQTRPEWGLAGHQALIIGPSWWALQESIQGKAFLHSYDFLNDTSNQKLEGIFQGPVNVAYLLNMQYFFPGLDKGLFSAGNKMLHQLSMLEMATLGNGSDLMLGLPIQSINIFENKDYHKPSRLFVVVYAQVEQVMAVLAAQKGLRQKFENCWMLLKIYDPMKKEWFDYQSMCELLSEKQAIFAREERLAAS